MSSGASGNTIARLDRIPVWPYGNKLLILIGAGYFFAFFDIVTIGLALPVITRQFGVSSSMAAWAVTTSLIGYIVGELLVSRVSDRFGRRISLLISVSLFTVGTVGAALSPGIWWLIVFRFIAGMGIGAEIAAVTTYVGELSPAAMRGRITSIVGVMSFAGFAAVPLVARILVPTFEDGWRVLFLVGAAGGLTIGVLRRRMPPSIRWLVAKGRTDEAEAALAAVESDASARTGQPLPDPEPAVAEPAASLRSKRNVVVLTLFTVMWLVYYVGNYAWLTMAPTLLTEHAGYSVTSSLTFLVVSGLGFILGAVIAAMLADVGRRNLVIASGMAVWALSLLGVGTFGSGVAVMGFGFIASATIGFVVPTLYALTAEQFATPIRATGVGITDGIGHLGGALAPAAVLAAAKAWDFEGAFVMMAVTGLVVTVLLLAVPFLTKDSQAGKAPVSKSS